MTQRFTAIIEREDNTYVALCPELDIASQGESVAEARGNLRGRRLVRSYFMQLTGTSA